VSATGFVCGTTSSGGSWNLTDGTHTITGVTTVTTPIGALVVGGSGTNATLTPVANTRTAASPTVTTADMGGTLWISSGGLTIPVISTGLFDAKQTLLAVNYAATPATVTNSSGQTINSTGGCSTAIPPGGFWQLQPNGTSIDCVQGGGNTPTTSGTNVTLAGSRAYYACTGTCTVTLPVPVAGAEFCIRNANNVATVITLAALGSSARYEATARTSYGSAGTGTFVSGGAVTDQVCVVGLDSTHYMTMSSTGTWTAS
jgi:hypothetical protein